MQTKEVYEAKLTKVGNSESIRIPKKLVDKLFSEKNVIIEETEEGLLISPKKKKISFKNAAIEMVRENEKWQEWEVFQNTGLKDIGDW
jgi:virulence-associated protein VagC